MTRWKYRARAFTLLELSVVLFVVALMTAILVRTVVTVRGRMGDVGCQGNMRQLLQAIQMYNNDHNGSMPYGFY